MHRTMQTSASSGMGPKRPISTFKEERLVPENFASVGFFCVWLCLDVFGVGTEFS